MFTMIRRIFNALVFTANIRHGVFPTAADTFAAVAITLIAAAGVWTKGAWIQIVLAAGVTADTNIWGFTLENFVGAASQGEVEIGIGTAPLGTMLGVYQITAAGYLFSKPLRVPAGNGIVARYRTSTGVADTVDIKLNVETGF